MIAENSGVMSFKAISVARAGTGNLSETLQRLTFHLLVRGVEAEQASGRAPLPRILQVWKDSEEIGSDKLFLADLENRLKEASKNLFDHKLHLGIFAAVPSDENELIQIADLFVSSLNRILNTTGERANPKDRFADYFLNRLGLPEGPIGEEREGDMTVHIAL